jgi:AmiR/NasT family two-component response regulator
VSESRNDYAVVLRPVAARFLGLGERADKLQADLNSRIVEQAKRAISACLGTTQEDAFEVLAALARHQGRAIEECAATVVAKGGAEA